MKFGDNLKLIRKSKNISQEDLADKLGVSRQSVSKWETGENYPSMQNIMCLCTIFKCKINELVHEDFVDINFMDEEIMMSVVKFKENEQKKMKGISKFIYVASKVIKIITIICIAAMAIASAAATYTLAHTNIDTKNHTANITGTEVTYEVSEEKLTIETSDDKYELELIGEGSKETIENVLAMSKAKRIILLVIIELSIIATLVVLMLIISYIERLFKNIHDNETPFNMDNVFFIKKIALFSLIYVLLQDVLGSLTELLFKLNLNVEIELTSYFVVLILLAVSYIFKYGYEIQLDSKGKMYGRVNE